MKRIIAIAIALAVQFACSTLQTLDGAKTVEPGRTEYALALSLQTGSNPLSYTGIPIPQIEFALRHGIAPDVDYGFRAYLLGAGFDVRYRFWHKDGLHLAVAPGVGGLYFPTVGGSFEVRAPLTAEAELTRHLDVSGGPRVVMRDQINPVRLSSTEKGRSARMDVFTGLSGRVELTPGKGAFVLGLGADVYAQPARHVVPGWSIGLDFGFHGKPADAPTDP